MTYEIQAIIGVEEIVQSFAQCFGKV